MRASPSLETRAHVWRSGRNVVQGRGGDRVRVADETGSSRLPDWACPQFGTYVPQCVRRVYPSEEDPALPIVISLSTVPKRAGNVLSPCQILDHRLVLIHFVPPLVGDV